MDKRSTELFDGLHQETMALFVRWKVYRSLYSDEPQDIDLLNLTDAAVFSVVQHLLFDDLILRLCKLTEPVDFPYDNLSVFKLQESLRSVDPVFVERRLAERLERLEEKCSKLRVVRNTRIAHAARVHALRVEAEPIPGLKRTDVEQPIRMLAAALNEIEQRYRGSKTYYGDILVPLSGDGQQLLDLLRRAQQGGK